MSAITDLVGRFVAPFQWKPGEEITAARLNAMMRNVVRYIGVGPGLRKVESPDGSRVIIGLEPQRPVGQGQWIVVTSNTQEPGHSNGTPNPDPVYRWKYSYKFPLPNNAPRWEGWNVASGAAETYAYNTAEVANTYNADVLGMGIRRTNLPAGWVVAPVPDNTPVLAYPRASVDDSGTPTVEMWFTFPNTPDGNCDSGGGA